MAKVFYVINYNEGEGGVDFFKTEKEALAYGKEQFEQFEMGKEVKNEDGTVYHGDALTFKKGILFSYEEDGTKLQAIEDADARQYAEDLEEMGSAVFFEGFVKGMYCFLGRDVKGKGMKWNYQGDGINESEVKSSLKYVQLFEQFTKENKNWLIHEEALHPNLSKKNLAKLKKLGHTGMKRAILWTDGNSSNPTYIQIPGEDGIPWGSKGPKDRTTFYWDGENAWCTNYPKETLRADYKKSVDTAEEFSDATKSISDSGKWEKVEKMQE